MTIGKIKRQIEIASTIVILVLWGLTSQADELRKATMYKPLYCGCCDEYAKYLEKNGFDVKIESMRSLSQIKTKAGIPKGFEGCHTLVVGGYVIDGLVPINTVNKLLTKRPKIAGITLPGMPWGAPGMDFRAKQSPLIIYAFKNGSSKPHIYDKD